ncbi:MAG TPA: multiheme c-type cytochrome [Flavitalea sp.]|nr:multiheme c-type cytochrome [Flavitalea sp.]
MKVYASYRRTIIIISAITISVFLLTKCINEKKEDNSEQQESQVETHAATWDQFAGSEACSGCHTNIYESHLATAHYLTSAPASAKTILGSFDTGKNSFVFTDRVKVVMEKRDTGFYQVAYLNGVEKQSRRFDIVVGSGTKGQSYLNWMNTALFQMPITYFTSASQWSNSPGYPGKAVFNRPITSRCLECHSTFVQKLSDEAKEPEDFDHNKIIYGVDCEKCHGPGAAHIEFQTKNPKDSSARNIINPFKLSRQQNLDLCALCHGGRLTKTRSSFSFQAGDRLRDYFVFDTVGRNAADIDVHGNQYGLLAASKCFKASEMTCSSCHNPHQNEKAKLAVFSQRCSGCHNRGHNKECRMKPVIGSTINENCIDCHMPKQPSRSIAVLLQGSPMPTPVLMRTHLIKVYPAQANKVLEGLK